MRWKGDNDVEFNQEATRFSSFLSHLSFILSFIPSYFHSVVSGEISGGFREWKSGEDGHLLLTEVKKTKTKTRKKKKEIKIS